jgi:ribosome biogenesis protein YTM1
MLDTPSIVPFQFLINGVFLRSSLEEYLTASGLSTETVVSLEYVRSFIPPIYESSFEHEDWVSSVDTLSGIDSIKPGQERILSGSYDGLLRMWNMSGQCIATSATASMGGHTQGIKTARFMSPTKIASAGMDRTIRIWQYSEADGREGTSGKLKPKLELYGHTQYIFSIDVQGDKILSGGGDDKIGTLVAGL